MAWLNEAWRFIKNEKKQKALAFIAGIAGAGWQVLNNLAALYRAQGQYAKAEPLYQRALAIREKALGAAHPQVAMSLNNLAEFYDNQGRYAKAEPLYQRALAILSLIHI